MLLFNLDAESRLAQDLAADMDLVVAPHEERAFEDGECKLRPLVDPRGDDVYVLQGLHGGPRLSPHDKLWRLLAFIATLRDHGAARVSAVLPYMAYGRKDRRTQPFDPVSQRYLAQLLESVGTAQVFVLEAHNPAALENAFRCPVVHLHVHDAFDGFVPLHTGARLVVASPDPGGVKRAQLWQESLQTKLGCPVDLALVDKRRSAGVVSSRHLVAGDVNDATVLLLDDLVSTGGTLAGAAQALRDAGAHRVVAFAAHGLFVPPADETLGSAALDGVVVTDSVPAFRVRAGGALHCKLLVATSVPLFANALRESHASWSR